MRSPCLSSPALGAALSFTGFGNLAGNTGTDTFAFANEAALRREI